MFSLFRKSRFSPLEQHLLEAVASELDPAAAALFRGQLAEVNLIQRHAGGKEVNAYVRRFGMVRRNPRLQFPNKTLEAKLATVVFHSASHRRPVRAEVFLVEGFFFSIMFNVSPKDLDTPRLIDEVTLEIGPMLRRPADARRPISISLTGYLADWQRRFHIRGAYEPLPEAERDRRLAAIHARLPDDYLELIRQSEGLEIEGCSIFGLGQIREMAGDGANYYLIAELPGLGVLGVRCDGTDGAVALLTFDDSIEYFSDFRSAAEKSMSGPPRDKRRR